MFGNLFNNKLNLRLSFLFLFLVILDQITKALVIFFFELYESIVILPFFNLTFVVNYGFAFGLFNNPSLNQILVSIIILIIILYLSNNPTAIIKDLDLAEMFLVSCVEI